MILPDCVYKKHSLIEGYEFEYREPGFELIKHWAYEFLLSDCFNPRNLQPISESDIENKWVKRAARCRDDKQNHLARYQVIFLRLLNGYRTNLVTDPVYFRSTFSNIANLGDGPKDVPQLVVIVHLLQVAAQLLLTDEDKNNCNKGYGPIVESMINAKFITLTEEQEKIVTEGKSNPEVVRAARRLCACTILQVMKNLVAQRDY